MYYVTKYALTSGIWAVQPEHAEESGAYLYIGADRHRIRIQVLKNDWFTDLEEAQARVEQQKEARLKSLRKALAKVIDYRAPVLNWKPGT